MKFKKLLISSSAIAASAGLFATVLTSCSCGSAKIDSKYKITLQDDGSFVTADGMVLTYHDAIKNALSRSSSWGEFKNALASEIVYKWYEDRAAEGDSKDKNTAFRNFLKEAKHDAEKDYDDKVDDLKSKHGAKYKFYLQNEYLTPNGGTKDSYIRSLIVDKVKTDFISKVFATNYFGLRIKPATEPAYPHFFSDVNTTPTINDIRNPSNWANIGFWAKSNGAYTLKDTSDTNLLAKYPDGDYATIQQFVFDRWFRTEKPFFSAAALFKYAKPKSAESLDKVYDGTSTKLPDAPNEAFPYFGGITEGESTDKDTGAKAYVNWYQELMDGTFQKDGIYSEDGVDKYNGSMSIDVDNTEDGQSLLLSYGSQMIAGTENTLYTPYAIAAASLYNTMLGGSEAILNELSQEAIEINLEDDTEFFKDDKRILSNFMYTTKPSSIHNCLDLNDVYGNTIDSTTEYHCPIFKPCEKFNFFYGVDGSKSGVRYVTNTFVTNLALKGAAHFKDQTSQPWVFELNEAGMHAQTIDCYLYVTRPGVVDKQAALKQAVMYRLLEQQTKNDEGMISASVLGTDGALSKYFSNNFANIILEMATSTEEDVNVFRDVESFKANAVDTSKSFLGEIINDEKFGVELSVLVEYLKATDEYDTLKKNYDAVVAANDKIYAYRSTQVTNSAVESSISQKVYENGILAPLPIVYGPAAGDYGSNHHYAGIVPIVVDGNINGCTLDLVNKKLESVEGLSFISTVAGTSENTDSAFSPQIKDAKSKTSNRFWFASTIVDKFMYKYMSDKNLANSIKANTYNKYNELAYTDEDKTNNINFKSITESETGYGEAFATIYEASKLFTDSKNFATYGAYNSTNFFTVMDGAYDNLLTAQSNADGQYNDEAMNKALFDITATYLAKNNFENFYKSLNSKISDNQRAMVGYLTKYNPEIVSPTYLSDPETKTESVAATYGWTANVRNIYDKFGYEGYPGGYLPPATDRVNFDQYWNVVNNGSTQLAGFLGIQTESNNVFDVNKKLKEAAFNNFARSVKGQSIVGSTTEVAQDDGSLFAWACPENSEKYIVPDVTWASKSLTIGDSDFVNIKEAKKLAKQIAQAQTVDDLSSIARSLDNALMTKGTIFDKIANGQYHFEDIEDPVNELKYNMLNALVKGEGTFTYKHCFQRLRNVELHDGMSDRYCFAKGQDGYKLMFTQINKSDIIEQTLTPKCTKDGNSYIWEMPTDVNSPVTINEFWFLFCQFANETSNQQLAVADAVNKVFGDGKLQVYDAQLYNQFDSTWIKDWEKKPMGPEA